ncbi:hypothetical protein D9M68_453570 [compost metagenome]
MGTLVIGHDDHLGPFADDRAATAYRTVDPRYISGAANVANGTMEIGLRGPEGEAARDAADRDGIAATMEGQRALASRTTYKEGSLVD